MFNPFMVNDIRFNGYYVWAHAHEIIYTERTFSLLLLDRNPM